MQSSTSDAIHSAVVQSGHEADTEASTAEENAVGAESPKSTEPDTDVALADSIWKLTLPFIPS
ncbi:hypothetical protein F1880_008591 [Penicillium rolfsii]|nr:hypothetical protein F1880_008591 [Penicillium rolfsii]